MAQRVVKCINCIYCIRLDNKILEKLFPDYPYICAVPFQAFGEPTGKPNEIINLNMMFFTESGVNQDTKCEFFKGWDI